MDPTQGNPVRVDSPSPSEVHVYPLQIEGAAPGASQSASEDDSKANTEKANGGTDADSGVGDQSMTPSRCTSQTNKLISPDKSTSRGWVHFGKQMERLNSAVQRATAISATQQDDTAEVDDSPIVIKTITLSLADNIKFLLPWDVCRTWQVVFSSLDGYLRNANWLSA